jgi:hypothetical protein
MKERRYNPIEEIWNELSVAWGPPDVRRAVVWAIHMRVGRIHGHGNTGRAHAGEEP